MDKHKSNQIKPFIQNTELYKTMRIDLLRALILGFISTVALITLIFYSYNYDNGLHGMAYLISGFVGLIIVLRNPGRPAQVNRKTFGIPKELSAYEKQLEKVMLLLRKRSIVVISTLPYFLWLLYIILNKDFPNRSNVEMIFGSSFLSFLTILILASSIQYFQIWLSLGKHKKSQ